MNVLARIRAGGREIECGLATTRQARAAVQAQRFRVDQHRGYDRLELRADRDVHDRRAIYFLAARHDGDLGHVLLGSARLSFGESRAGFRFPAEHAVEFALPAETRDIAASQRVEVSRGRSGHRHQRAPVAPVYWLTDEMASSLLRAIAVRARRAMSGRSFTRRRGLQRG